MPIPSKDQTKNPVNGLHARLAPISSLEILEQQWRKLESESDGSFFTSWSWIGTWVRQNQDECRLQLFELHSNDVLVALAIVDIESITRRKIIRSTTATLNEAADIRRNMFIEYNGILTKRGFEENAWRELLEQLCTLKGWDEIRLTNVTANVAYEEASKKLGLTPVVDAANSAWVTSIDADTNIDNIISKLGKNKRWQLRRSIKEYQKEGELSIDAATTAQQAQEYFQSMGILHRQRWQRVGEPGSYAYPRWVEFHTNLIEAAFNRGEIQLLRVQCGDRPIGFIYNFLWRGAVLVLQTGFATETHNTLRPGYVSHLLAMQFNAQRGFRQYDFMIGDSEYKSTLAHAGSHQMTVRLQRNRLKFRAERTLQPFVRLARRLTQNTPFFITAFLTLPGI